MSESKVKVVLVGHGFLGRWHAQKADQLDTSQLVAIVERNRDNWNEIKAAYPKVELFEDIEQVDVPYDAAVVASSSSSHFLVTKFLIENKKHIFCEKPLVTTLSELENLSQFITKSGYSKTLQVGHSERYHACFDEPFIKEHLANFVKDAFYVSFVRVGEFKERVTDVSVATDLMIHDVDLCLHLFGHEVEEVQTLGKRTFSQSLDWIHTSLSLASGAKIEIQASRMSKVARREIQILSPKGSVHIDLQNCHVTIYDGASAKEIHYDKRDHLLLEQQEFYDAILEGKKPKVGMKEASQALRLLSQIEESLNLKGITKIEKGSLSSLGR